MLQRLVDDLQPENEVHVQEFLAFTVEQICKHLQHKITQIEHHEKNLRKAIIQIQHTIDIYDEDIRRLLHEDSTLKLKIEELNKKLESDKQKGISISRVN